LKSQTFNSNNVRDMVHSVSDAVVKDLRIKGLI
jgi:hypothetical protein